MKRQLSVLVSAMAVLVIGVGVAFGVGILSLPSGPVCVTHGTWNAGTNSTLDITLSSVPDGFDVTNDLYTGWCAEDNHQGDYNECEALLLDSTDTEPLECGDDGYLGYPWDRINYLLNHKGGADGTIPASVQDIQVAIWLLNGTYDGTWSWLGQPTAAAYALEADANAYGGSFVPGPGEIVAVVICSDGDSPGGYQDTLIELELRSEEEPQGCTPGYWKQPQHLFAWVPTGFAPDNPYGTVFGVDDTFDLTLRRALQIGGGGERALYRHATAALLNAASPDVNYPYTVAEVIAMVQNAYSTANFEDAKDLFETANEAYCPLGNDVESVAGQGATSQSN